MGVCYEQGLGVQRDLAEALRHYRQSAAMGSRQARDRLRAWQQELQGTRASRAPGAGALHGRVGLGNGACIARGGLPQGHCGVEFFVLKGRRRFSSSVLPIQLEKLFP